MPGAGVVSGDGPALRRYGEAGRRRLGLHRRVELAAMRKGALAGRQPDTALIKPSRVGRHWPALKAYRMTVTGRW